MVQSIAGACSSFWMTVSVNTVGRPPTRARAFGFFFVMEMVPHAGTPRAARNPVPFPENPMRHCIATACMAMALAAPAPGADTGAEIAHWAYPSAEEMAGGSGGTGATLSYALHTTADG